MNIFQWFFNTANWPPRWRCGIWSEGLGWTHIISDFLIFASYLTITICLGYFVVKRKDLPVRKLVILFGAFIFFCGWTHLNDVIIFYFPFYRFSTLIKAITAIVSWATVFVLFPYIPKVLKLPELTKIKEMLETKLRVKSEALQIVFEVTGAGTWEWDLQTNQVALSETLSKIFPPFQGKHEVIYHEFFNIFSTEDRGKVVSMFQNNRQDEGPYQTQFHIADRSENGQAMCYWKVLFSPTREPIRLIGCITTTPKNLT